MRLTVMGQLNKGMQKAEARRLIQAVEQYLESAKHHLWNGNVVPALRVISLWSKFRHDFTHEKIARFLRPRKHNVVGHPEFFDA